jgi:hypothetical protein
MLGHVVACLQCDDPPLEQFAEMTLRSLCNMLGSRKVRSRSCPD